MSWTCMSATKLGNVFLCQRRNNSATNFLMLSDVLEPSITELHLGVSKNNVIFQHDNAPFHRVKNTR